LDRARKNIELDLKIPNTYYLAVPSDVYNSFFKLQLTQASIKANRIKYLVYDVEKEVIVKWKN